MLRGVNRQIIEVKDTGSRYFERALLIVRPEFAQMQPGQLEREADKYLASVGRPPALRPAGPSRRPSPSYAARMARTRRRRRLARAVLVGLGVAFCLLLALGLFAFGT